MFRIGKIVFDERMAEIERSGPWIGAVTFSVIVNETIFTCGSVSFSIAA